MDQPTIAGIATLGVPLLIVGLLFRRAMAIFLFYVALVVVGIGYLASTGAIADIGNFALETIGVRGTDTVPMVPPAEKMPAPAPAP